ncbi:STAS domain-containing protein [Kitasatospora sp. NPDC097605]|uniref:STAS domain-containing protein n=1 Tax=Kitasatospora sp. NPDC097605 TaxID=3157226 RepID=UPI00332277F6
MGAAADAVGHGVVRSVTRDRRARTTVVRLSGELDMLTAPDLVPELLGLADDGDRELVLDLSGVDFCDSTGADAFLQVNRRLSKGNRLSLRGVPRQPARVLRLLGLNRSVRCEFAQPAPAGEPDRCPPGRRRN